MSASRIRIRFLKFWFATGLRIRVNWIRIQHFFSIRIQTFKNRLKTKFSNMELNGLFLNSKTKKILTYPDPRARLNPDPTQIRLRITDCLHCFVCLGGGRILREPESPPEASEFRAQNCESPEENLDFKRECLICYFQYLGSFLGTYR